MIDIWSIATILIPFFEVCIHTTLDVMRQRKMDAIAEKGLHLFTCVIDIFIIFFVGNITQVMQKWAGPNLGKNKVTKFDEEIEYCDKFMKIVKIFSKYVLPLLFIVFAFSFFIAGKIALES